jgi:hypothetical protein
MKMGNLRQPPLLIINEDGRFKMPASANYLLKEVIAVGQPPNGGGYLKKSAPSMS